ERACERKRQSILRVELEWVLRGARARTTTQKGRLQRYEDLKNQKGPTEELSVEMESVSSRLGRTTVELSDICKAYGDKVLIKDYTYFFLKNDRIGYIGPNGSGKSTLMKIIAGWEKPDSGTIEIGQTVKMGYFSQENEDMDTSLKVIDYIKNVAEYVKTKDGSISASQMLERFLFPPSVQYTVIGKLSGGERRRLYLLKILMDAPNVLILDEPTNDLDIKTLMILEDYLDSFQGIVITVSHDRYFLDRVVRRIFAFEGDGVIRQYEGGFTDYQIKKEAEMAALGETAGSGAGAKGGKAAAAANAAEPAKKTEKPREKKLKFTYMEQREWDTIEDDMAALEDKIADLDAQIAASATNYGKLRELMAAKEETEAKLEEKMERWMYLNDLAEKIAEQNK
ncbi:MAG: ABC-F family ATP-binding cassette domain-containing protein, partial [Lachnospiraceae bacterium]|nr:ABC-F family ATP-binding cassette domain-containing protein [Lachnospiraceae bacterium]